MTTTQTYTIIKEPNAIGALADRLHFSPIDKHSMPAIMDILRHENGRTTDFSYGGILMWVDFFHYEYAILDNTLFIKGRVENDRRKMAFSLPVGSMSLKDSIDILKAYCAKEGHDLILSAVPEYAIEDLKTLSPQKIETLEHWSDYLYSAQSLSTLSGKKYGKKRNHVNKFVETYPEWHLEPLSPVNVESAISFMGAIDLEGDNNPMAVAERNMNINVLHEIADGDTDYIGAILYTDRSNIAAYTVADIKGDTLFIHIEKALREIPGGFEMINKAFAESVCAAHPEIEYINREDDAGDLGLRMAKESYHPLDLLKKYNVMF